MFAGSKLPPGRDSTGIMVIVKMSARRFMKLACGRIMLITKLLASTAPQSPIAAANWPRSGAGSRPSRPWWWLNEYTTSLESIGRLIGSVIIASGRIWNVYFRPSGWISQLSARSGCTPSSGWFANVDPITPTRPP